jgi:hypothetical protein
MDDDLIAVIDHIVDEIHEIWRQAHAIYDETDGAILWQD